MVFRDLATHLVFGIIYDEEIFFFGLSATLRRSGVVCFGRRKDGGNISFGGAVLFLEPRPHFFVRLPCVDILPSSYTIHNALKGMFFRLTEL